MLMGEQLVWLVVSFVVIEWYSLINLFHFRNCWIKIWQKINKWNEINIHVNNQFLIFKGGITSSS